MSNQTGPLKPISLITPDCYGAVFNTSDVIDVAINLYANGPDMLNFTLESVETDTPITGQTTITINPNQGLGEGGERFAVNGEYVFSSTRTFGPNPPILYKSNPSQIKPLCGNRTIQVWWSAPVPNGVPIDGYTIEIVDVTTGLSVDIISVSSNVYTYIITGLTNGDSYQISVASYDNTNEAYSSPVYYREVQPGFKSDPPIVNSAVITRYGSNNTATVKVIWSPPASLPLASIKWYVVEAVPSALGVSSGYQTLRFQAKSTDRFIDLSNTMASLLNPLQSQFSPYQYSYTFNVYAVNDVGYSLLGTSPGGTVIVNA
jgi:hypothetical protein